MIDKLEVRFLSTFLAVLEEGSFSGAAEKLGYVQSTVTAQIRLLEESCRQKLFHRLPRGVKPTDAGEQMAVYARQFMRLGQSLEEALGGLAEPRGIVRAAALESFCVTRLTGFLRPFFERHPLIALQLDTGFQADLVEQVVSHAVDFAIVPKDPEREDIEFEPLANEKMVLAAAPGLVRRVEKVGLNKLNGIQFIGFGRRCIYQTQGLKLLTELGLPQDCRLAEYPSTEMVRQLLACGLGIAFVPEIAIRRELADGELETLPMAAPVTLTHGLIRHRSRVLNTPSRLFHDMLLAYFAEVGPT